MNHVSTPRGRALRPTPVFLACALLCATPLAAACDATDTASLAACFASAAPGDTVRLLNDITLTSHTGLITTDLTIDGQGFTLDGAGTHRGFFVDRGAVTVQNITLRNLRAKGGDGGAGALDNTRGTGGGGGMGAGGALFVRSGASVVLRDVNLSGSQAIGGAGGDSRTIGINAGFASGAGGGLGGDGAGLPTVNAGHGGGGTFEDGGGATPASFYPQVWGAGGTGGGPAGGVGSRRLQEELNQVPTPAGDGGDHSGGGGGGPARSNSAAGDGGFGGGGGSSPTGPAGNGGFGGGAGSSWEDFSAVGGFGGGGAGRARGAAGPGGFGGGSGSVTKTSGHGAGGGGAAMGGAIFVMDGARITFEGTVHLDGSSVAGGPGGNPSPPGSGSGQAFGPGIFLQGSSAVIVFNPAAGAVQTVADGMADQTGSGGTGNDAGRIGIAKTGEGELVLGGEHTHSGGTTVEAGRLVVTGRIQGDTTVRAGAELAGSGTVGSTRVRAGGRLAPGNGNGIGTLTVQGDLDFAPGSVLAVDATPSEADRLDVSGAVTIAGGTVRVRAGTGRYGRLTEYRIVDAAAGLSGTFDGASTDLAFLVPTLVYGQNGLVLRLSANEALSYRNVARTDNQAAVAAHLDAFAAAPPNADAAALINALDNTTTAQAIEALTGLGGSAHLAATLAAHATGTWFHQALADRTGFGPLGLNQAAPSLAMRLRPTAPPRPLPSLRASGAGGIGGATPASGPQAWAQAVGGSASVPGDGNGPASQHRATGLVVGQDGWVGTDWWLGGALGHTRARWRADTQGLAPASGHIDSWNAGLYAHHHWGDSSQWRLRLDATWSQHRFDARRTVSLGGPPLEALSRHPGREVALGAEVGHSLPLGQPGSGWRLQRLLGLRHARLRQDAFDETGAGPADLSVRARTFEGTVVHAGVRWELDGEAGRAMHLGLEASHRLGDLTPRLSASLAGQQPDFAASGTALRRQALTLSAGGSVPLSTRVVLFGSASAEWRGAGQNSHSVTAGLRLGW